jgi:hypothetical protein
VAKTFVALFENEDGTYTARCTVCKGQLTVRGEHADDVDSMADFLRGHLNRCVPVSVN